MHNGSIHPAGSSHTKAASRKSTHVKDEDEETREIVRTPQPSIHEKKSHHFSSHHKLPEVSDDNVGGTGHLDDLGEILGVMLEEWKDSE